MNPGVGRFFKWPHRGRAIRLVAVLLVGLPLLATGILVAGLALSPKPDLLKNVCFGGVALDDKGDLLRMGLAKDQKYRLAVSLEDVPGEAIEALLYYEDRHFYSHPGVNLLAIGRSLAGWLGSSGRKMGASTITMQVARLRFGLNSSTWSGKLRQIWEALRLEWHYTKGEILEAYFNLAPYGGNIEGIEAAARVYFHKPACALTPAECRALAVTPQNPAKRNPLKGKDFELARARLEKAMGLAGPATPLRALPMAQLPFTAPHASMELLGEKSEGKAATGIQPDLQELLENSIRSFVERGKRFGLENAAALLVECDSMQIRALAGSADFFDNSIQGQVDGTRARRSPGSTLKPFIYALAVDSGLIHPQTILPDSPRSFGGYDPENFDLGFRGPISAKDALLASRNLPAIVLAEQLPEPGLYGFLRKGGVQFEHDAGHYGLALALGGAETSMRELAGLYAMLANQGLWRPVKLKKQEDTAPVRLLSPEAAWLTLWMLEREECFVEGRGGSVPIRYKTGTSNGLRDAWTCGIVGQYALVVWVGNFDNRSNPLFVGAKSALPLFLEISRSLASFRELCDVQDLREKMLSIATGEVCSATGGFESGSCERMVETKYIPGISPTGESGILRPVLIDKKTGLRACAPGENTRVEWLEFWPSDMAAIFAQAGIIKPSPPDWLPQCTASAISRRGKNPRILLPRKNVAYQRRISETDFKLPLQAACEPDAAIAHWYGNAAYLGSSRPGEVFYWESPPGGENEIRVVDDQGRGSSQKCLIETAP